MDDDWRLQIQVHDSEHAGPLVERLDARELQHDLSDAFHDQLIVSRDGDDVFVYAGTQKQAEDARDLIQSLAEQHGWAMDADLKRWHPGAEEWEDPAEPSPDTDAAERAEHDELIAGERKEVEDGGDPEFEVRVDFPSRHDAIRFAQQLRDEGLPVVRRSKYLLVGVTDEDSAATLADRIRGEAPSDSQVKVEGTWKAALDERPSNPFAVFGGLGG
jgi:hypothetical protein